MKIFFIFIFSGIIYLFSFSHIDSTGLFAQKNCQCDSFNVLTNYYNEYQTQGLQSNTCNTDSTSQFNKKELADNNQLSDYYTQYVSH
ncbi:MAG: hypothetical protein IME94_03200 [Proteobacteria bacterium]|nr:hypothetical protein [Pseudomonadota bacterium]